MKCDICGEEHGQLDYSRFSLRCSGPGASGGHEVTGFDVCLTCSDKILGQHKGPASIVEIAKGLLVRAFGDTVA